MSLFEDLVEELKEENLLEETVIEARSINGKKYPVENGTKPEREHSDPAAQYEAADRFELAAEDLEFESYHSVAEPESSEPQVASVKHADSEEEEGSEEPVVDYEDSSEMKAPVRPAKRNQSTTLARHHAGETGKQYFRRRATDEVRTLQMVDHIITRVEKEQAKVNAVPYDDLKVKQSLHRFLQLDEEVNAAELAEIEFLLLQETESWYSALTLRDREISVENLRSYCEATVPSLSTQALLALARFYRNAPFSELVRCKFDLIITKLYTEDSGEGRREVALSPGELEKDIKDLYKEWSSIPLYASDVEEQELEFGAMGFEDFIEEAKRAHSFDELVSKDFFRRLNDFKEKANESFFAPHVVAAAIRCNVAVGNRYLELIENEHGGMRPEVLSDKYGFLSDSAISEAIRKVFAAHEEDVQEKARIESKKKQTPREIFDVDKISAASSAMAQRKVEWYRANKKLVAATALTVIFGIFYFYLSPSLFSTQEGIVSSDVQEINLDNSEFSEFVASARISKSTVYAITNEQWGKLPKPQKEDIMKRFLATGTDKGFTQINFLDNKGRKIGYVSATRLELED